MSIDCDIVHFSNLTYGEALAVQVKNGEVEIPNQLLANGSPVHCWAFILDENGAYTKQEQTIDVIKRGKPSDYVYTQTEVITIQAAVENALEKAKESGDFKGDKGDKGEKGEKGEQGEPGKDGADGKDGTSATHSWNGTVLTITSASGTSSADLKGEKGDKGDTGAQGIQGIQGEKGADGFSPIVSVNAIEGGHHVTVTDKDGAHTFDVMDGQCGQGGGVADWNASEGETGYVKNRTHYEETTVVNEPLNITWDGNTEGLVIVADVLFKVSDLVLTDEQIKTATVTLSNGSAIYIGDVWENMVSNEMVAEDCVVFEDAAAVFVRKDNIEIYGLTFTQKGIYFTSYNGVYITSFTTTEPVEQTKTMVKKLDKKFLPNVADLDAGWLAELKTALGIS